MDKLLSRGIGGTISVTWTSAGCTLGAHPDSLSVVDRIFRTETKPATFLGRRLATIALMGLAFRQELS